MPARTAMLVLLTSVLAATSAHAGVIRGTVSMKSRASIASTASTTGRAPAALDPRGVMDAVLYVQQIPDLVEEKLANPTVGVWMFRRPVRPRNPRIVQTMSQFVPHVMAIAAGSQVEFLNLDKIYHNAFSVSAARRFDLGKYAPGRMDSIRFARPGVINLHCDIHSEEFGYVVVTPNHAIARPDSVGAYVLPKLPPGHYTVTLWHPKHGEVQRKVEMPKRGNVTLDLGF